MLIAAGNINENYSVLGIVHASAARSPENAGCFQPAAIPIEAAYQDALQALVRAAGESGANGLIHVSYDYRMSSRNAGCNNIQPSFEVYCWGTAIILDHEK